MTNAPSAEHGRAFSEWPVKPHLMVPLDRKFPSYLTVFSHELGRKLSAGDTHYIYAHGEAFLSVPSVGDFLLRPGMFAVVPGECSVQPFKGHGIAVSREDWLGYFQIGGPIEHEGRLKYIDGCTDSLLASPPKMGDPCLNLLYFPPGIDQTSHTHPSDRIGMIMSGRGECVFDNGDGEGERVVELSPGMIFTIHAEGQHKFRTPFAEDMRVLAYHPDSDFGPTDEEHPMLNRTIVDGVSAKHLEDIRTK